jgi:hypothetical protein
MRALYSAAPELTARLQWIDEALMTSSCAAYEMLLVVEFFKHDVIRVDDYSLFSLGSDPSCFTTAGGFSS